MPESLRPLVKDVAERMQVPLDFPAVAAIATLAGVTNRRAMIQPKERPHLDGRAEPLGRYRCAARDAQVSCAFLHDATGAGNRERMAQGA